MMSFKSDIIGRSFVTKKWKKLLENSLLLSRNRQKPKWFYSIM